MRFASIILYMAVSVCFLPVGVGGAGERAFSWTLAPGRGDYVGVNLNVYRLSKYLEECEVNRPEIVDDVKTALRDGEFYRKKTTDQKARPVRLTVNVSPDFMLRIATVRNETCPDCKGSGKKEMPFGKVTGGVGMALNCLRCKGKGHFSDKTTEKYYILSAEDFENPKEGRRVMREQAFSGAPEGADRWIGRLTSRDPRERLEACEWLDKNYVRVGVEFQRLMPMLKKARYQEANEKRRIMVWQFWAGKDLPEARDRAFYRIYVNSKSGKVTQKGFFAAQ